MPELSDMIRSLPLSAYDISSAGKHLFCLRLLSGVCGVWSTYFNCQRAWEDSLTHLRPSARFGYRSDIFHDFQDVLAICGADLPAWCAALVFDYKFMLPFALRSRYFHCTAFGLARALQHLQLQQAAEGAATQPADRDARELRVGRIQRQKVQALGSCQSSSFLLS
jgi:hypothetical protein